MSAQLPLCRVFRLMVRAVPAALLAALVLPAPPSIAGVVWKAHHVPETATEPPAPAFVRTVRIEGEKMRIDGGTQSIIVRLDEGLVWTILHEDKIYQELPFAQIGRMMANMEATLKTFPPEQRAAMEAMFKRMGTPFTRVELIPTGEKRTIADHPCTEITIRGGPVESTICVATDLKPAADAIKFYLTMSERLASTPGLDSLRAQAEAFSKLQGVVVRETNVSKTATGERTEVFDLDSYESAVLPAEIFELPTGLTREPNMLDQMVAGARAAEQQRDKETNNRP